MKVLIGVTAALIAACACAEMRPDGHFGKRLDKMLANHVEATDPVKLAALYREETKGHWQTEFWGKLPESKKNERVRRITFPAHETIDDRRSHQSEWRAPLIHHRSTSIRKQGQISPR